MKRAACLLLAVLFLLLAGCKADLSAYADTPITVMGLTDEPFTVTPAELAQLKCVDAKARGNSDKAGTRNHCPAAVVQKCLKKRFRNHAGIQNPAGGLAHRPDCSA